MIRHRSRMMFLAAALMCAVSASSVATATDVAYTPGSKAQAAHSVPAMPVSVADHHVALATASPSLAVVAVAVGSMIAGPVNPVPHRPREKPRLWG